MRILHVTHHFHPCIGGIETFVKGLCTNLKKQGIDSEVLCLNKCPNSKEKLPKTAEFEGMKITRIGFIDLKYYKVAFFPLSLLKKFDVIHIHNIGFFSDFLLLTKFLHKKPIVISTHGGIWHTKKMFFLKKIYFEIFQYALLNTADLLIADSVSDFELFSKKIKKIKLLENAIDFSKFSGIKKQTFEPNFLFLGRLSKNKNIPALINVFEIVCKSNPNVKLFIVGQNFDENIQELKSTIAKKNLEKHIFLTGQLSEKELKKIIEKCSYCIYASTFEGFGISVLELMSAGLIPILNKISAFQRFVAHQKNGFLCNFSDKKATSQTILSAIKLSNEKKQKLSLAAQEKIKEYFWDKKINKYIMLYKQVSN